MTQVVHISGERDDAWDGYVGDRTTSATDLSGWRRVLESVYGIPYYGFAAIRGTSWCGALMLYEIRHRIFGHFLVTAPFGNDGGLFYDDDEACQALLSAARDLAAQRDVDYLLIRTRETELPGFEVERRYMTAVTDLAGDEESFWNGGFNGKTRNQIRKGLKSGFTLEAGPSSLEPFVEVFQLHMRDLGSPAHGRGFYQAIQRELADRCTFLVARKDGRLAAGALLFQHNGTAMNLHTVALRRYNRDCVNYLMYWELFRRSIAAGCHAFDMGRSVQPSGNLAFKKNWNPRMIQLTYNYHLRKLESPPFLDPRNRKFALATSVWRRLPMWVARQLGPPLIRGLP